MAFLRAFSAPVVRFLRRLRLDLCSDFPLGPFFGLPFLLPSTLPLFPFPPSGFAGNPLPPIVHRILPEYATRGRRVILIGDVHGSPEDFVRLLEVLEYEPGQDVLTVVGDTLNKGHDPVGAVEVVTAAVMDPTLVVRGNNDDDALSAWRAWRDGKPIPQIKKHFWVVDMPVKAARIVSQFPFSLSFEAYGAVGVHAGLVPGVRLGDQKLVDILRMRDVAPADRYDDAVEAAERWTREAKRAHKKGLPAPPRVPPKGDPMRHFDWSEQAWLQREVAEGDDLTPKERARVVPLAGVERHGPLGHPWAGIYGGPWHVFFGHDSSMGMQLEEFATGIDTGHVTGGALTAAILPPLDEEGQPLPDYGKRPKPPKGSIPIKLGGSGIECHVFSYYFDDAKNGAKGNAKDDRRNDDASDSDDAFEVAVERV